MKLKSLHFLFVGILLTVTNSFSQSGLGTIRGSVIDADSKQAVPYAKILLKHNGTIRGGANTDEDGKFQINSIDPGSYDIEISNPGDGYQPSAINGVIVNADRITFLDNTVLHKPSEVKNIEEMVVTAYRVPLIDKDGGASGGTMTREDISRLPVRSAAGVARTVGGVNTNEDNGDISVRGARADATTFYIDGIKVRGSSNLPKSALEEVTVITGGLPANYGDITGGVISVTTRGPSSTYFGSVEAISSGFYFKGKDPDGYDGKVFGLDKYAYNMIEGMASGPLFMKRDSTGEKVRPILGFLVSVNYNNTLDNRPLNGGNYRIKKEVRDQLLANPMRPTIGSQALLYQAQELRRDEDFEKVDWRMNVQRQVLTAQAKIDVNTGPSMNLSFGGSMNFQKGNIYSRSNSLMNFQHYGVSQVLDWRVFGRLTQRFSNDREGSASKIKSAFYSLMVDYSQRNRQEYDPKHKYNIFNYGHVGTFTSDFTRSFLYIDSLNAYVQETVPYQETVHFNPSNTNPALAAVTTQLYRIALEELGADANFQNFEAVRGGSGLLNGDAPTNIYNMWGNYGAPYNGFLKQEWNQFRVSGSGSVNIGDHSVSLGFEYEQRVDRLWGSGDLGPMGIWGIARLYANSHISELDLTSPIIVQEGAFKTYYYDRLNSGYASKNNGVYGGPRSAATGGIEDAQTFFDYNVRKALGLNPGGNDYIQIDAMDPNMFNLGMFSPDEIMNNGNSYVTYYGYDHTGKKVKGRTDIDKYVNEFDENGNYKRFVGAFRPTYMSAYIMDKFAFRDLVFNVGLRVDLYDANQPVLKDPFLMQEALTAREAKALVGQPGFDWVDIPNSIGDDYIVYVNDIDAPTAINGFRNESTWYNANGDFVDNPITLRGAGGIAPWLRTPGLGLDRISSGAFEDYKAQVNFMPRIAFSFPVSDESSFFAHYDILTQRPTIAQRFDPYAYQFVRTRNAAVSNPNLKPSQTIDYELGFQQVLSRTSSLKISAFYREQRDDIQMINVVEAFPASYRTFGNIDFGTVKGLTVTYDLRRTGNIRMTLSYTLQFADGTGSDAESMSGLVSAGVPNLRSIFPYSYDQRHNFAVNLDYRYASGRDYNGPMINDFAVLENTGINILTNFYSGTPYSRQMAPLNQGLIRPTSSGLSGTTNGSRLPWASRLDVQLDRTFQLSLGKTEDKKKDVFLNVYVVVSNLFNVKNVLKVYGNTGNWDNDGYLEADINQSFIAQQQSPESFREFQQMKVQDPHRISIPRTIRLGIKFDF